MSILVTGCAGFIGANLVERLLANGCSVVGYDNLSTGSVRHVDAFLENPSFTFERADILDTERLDAAMRGCDTVFHLAANADVRHGVEHPFKDLQQNALGTFNVLESMRRNGVRRIAFASTGSVYGEATTIPTPEDAPFPVQTSLYGASKLAAEGLVQAFCEGFGFQGYIFRFVSILGERYSHGHVFDFVKALKKDPGRLCILGDGKQRKSYLYVRDCVDAILLAMRHSEEKVSIFNLGTDEYCRVDDSADWICRRMGVSPERIYTGGERGWIGDNPFIYLDCRRIRALGWRPEKTIREGVELTVDYLLANPWIFQERS